MSVCVCVHACVLLSVDRNLQQWNNDATTTKLNWVREEPYLHTAFDRCLLLLTDACQPYDECMQICASLWQCPVLSLSPFSWPRTLWGRRIYDQSPKASSQKLVQARHGLHSRTLLGKEDLRPKPQGIFTEIATAGHKQAGGKMAKRL